MKKKILFLFVFLCMACSIVAQLKPGFKAPHAVKEIMEECRVLSEMTALGRGPLSMGLYRPISQYKVCAQDDCVLGRERAGVPDPFLPTAEDLLLVSWQRRQSVISRNDTPAALGALVLQPDVLVMKPNVIEVMSDMPCWASVLSETNMIVIASYRMSYMRETLTQVRHATEIQNRACVRNRYDNGGLYMSLVLIGCFFDTLDAKQYAKVQSSPVYRVGSQQLMEDGRVCCIIEAFHVNRSYVNVKSGSELKAALHRFLGLSRD